MGVPVRRKSSQQVELPAGQTVAAHGPSDATASVSPGHGVRCGDDEGEGPTARVPELEAGAQGMVGERPSRIWLAGSRPLAPRHKSPWPERTNQISSTVWCLTRLETPPGAQRAVGEADSGQRRHHPDRRAVRGGVGGSVGEVDVHGGPQEGGTRRACAVTCMAALDSSRPAPEGSRGRAASAPKAADRAISSVGDNGAPSNSSTGTYGSWKA